MYYCNDQAKHLLSVPLNILIESEEFIEKIGEAKLLQIGDQERKDAIGRPYSFQEIIEHN